MAAPRNHHFSAPPPTAPDADPAVIVARAKGGDIAAFAQLYRRHVGAVYDFAAHRLGQREDAEDATQTVFLRAAQSLHQCRDDAAFVGWLFAIARNVVADKLRMRRFRVASLDDLTIEDPSPSPADLAVRAAQQAELWAARSRCLNDDERELYDLLAQDLTHAEIAAALGRRPGAVRTRHWRLLDKLRVCLGLETGGKRHALA